MSKRVLAAALTAVLAIAGCGSGENTPAGPRTLKLWHYEGPDSAMGVAWAEAIKQFEATHPNVKVAFEEKGFEQIQKTAPMIMNSGDAPDVMEYNKGNATAGLLSKQGLLTDISQEVAKRGWDKQLSPAIQTTARYDEKGVMGSGKWYGIPNYAEYVMVYYNKDMFAQKGIEVPKTLDELTSAMDKFVGAGVTPLAVGGAEYPAHQIMYQLALTKADRNWVDRYQRYTGSVDFHDAAWTYGANTFADWVRKGYVSKDSAGVKAEDMGVSFIQGKHPIMITGTWWYGRIAAGIKDFQWGSFPWPGMTAGSAGNMWVVPKGSKNKDLAYDFIAITMSQPIQDKLRDAGGVPLVAGSSPAASPQIKELTDTFSTLSSQDRLAFYPDWPAPGYYAVQVSAVQKLITATASAGQVLDEIAKPYQENLANVGK
ncbi:raffinose/stachyose/melibiose transport system substrate-binding protein [Kibdelosporangium banguiense]|uniref:Raffinose/stachyose/melibiose transport system substrate-binding protein n=1 Tax=Kibdelosporangium banguiense TaxID=1365924 RepID=A0ABS4TPY1_9PSEU|nr:extracellular solute-binding protein [Kibdelosporangium banguiense]MBP2325961.1 raffinose/stachyose/melibiose transport system substrate-binding protein [Kibdelosporangium banguiense]